MWEINTVHKILNLKGIYAILSRISKCHKSRVLVLIFWVKKLVGANFLRFCNSELMRPQLCSVKTPYWHKSLGWMRICFVNGWSDARPCCIGKPAARIHFGQKNNPTPPLARLFIQHTPLFKLHSGARKTHLPAFACMLYTSKLKLSESFIQICWGKIEKIAFFHFKKAHF